MTCRYALPPSRKVRRAEAHRRTMLQRRPLGAPTEKASEALTEQQRLALEELETSGFATAEAYRAKGNVTLGACRHHRPGGAMAAEPFP